MNVLTPQFPLSGPADPPPPPGCPHREWNAGRQSFGPAVPAFAQGACFPGDEPGARCELSGQSCDPHPAFCPLWRPSNIACPACLAFTHRRRPRGVFSQSLLLARPADETGPPRPHGPGLYCPACDEEYADLTAVALAALDRLRDLLDDLNFVQGSLEQERAKTTVPPPPAVGETPASLARLRGLLDDLGFVQDSLEALRKKTSALNAGAQPPAGDAAHTRDEPHPARPHTPDRFEPGFAGPHAPHRAEPYGDGRADPLPFAAPRSSQDAGPLQSGPRS